MDWLKAVIVSENPDEVCDSLYAMDIASVQIEDAGAFEDFLENNKKYWDYVDESLTMPPTPRVSFYLENTEKSKKLLSEISKSFDTLTVEKVCDEDWANNWKEYYKPLHIGKSVVIRPVWEEYAEKPGEKVITLDPGAAFGTGSHETTSMCIELLEEAVGEGARVLDVGCGSGILSVASCVLGAKNVTAVDIDEFAVKTAAGNAELNGIGADKFTAVQGSLTDNVSGKFDVIVANIVADVIISLCRDVGDFLEDCGAFICSGIIDDRVCDVKNAFAENGFVIEKAMHKKEWNAFLLVKGELNA
ncbi:MAG: 50S ribosomal protein L11 methyltransferase [Clostridia bacterium]|nr:50S ribosomal protein L11 methyltransferase [Clostridia bacterium]